MLDFESFQHPLIMERKGDSALRGMGFVKTPKLGREEAGGAGPHVCGLWESGALRSGGTQPARSLHAAQL